MFRAREARPDDLAALPAAVSPATRAARARAGAMASYAFTGAAAFPAAALGDVSPRRASFSDDGAPPWELIDALLGGPGAGEDAGLSQWEPHGSGGAPRLAAALQPAPAAAPSFLAPPRRVDALSLDRGAASGSARPSGCVGLNASAAGEEGSDSCGARHFDARRLRCLDPSHAQAAGGGTGAAPACGCVNSPGRRHWRRRLQEGRRPPAGVV